MKIDKKSFQKIPQVGKLLEDSFFKALYEKFSKEEVLLAIKNSIEEIKNEDLREVSKEEIKERIKMYSINFLKYPFRRVINATGILIHTNLGRAPLIKTNKNLLEGYSNLEIDIKNGKRGERNSLSEKLLCHLTQAEGALVLNNNAGAVLLLLSTFARGGEVLISRGELVEIGGSFRLPEILAESGCTMVEVGTTNKTRIKDYENGLTDKTKVILKVHQSNFRIVGYTESPSIEEICEFSHKKGLSFFVDQGNGLLYEIEGFNLKGEEPVLNLIKKGVDVVTFSGDKLLGGPQSGICVGKKEYINKMIKNPLYRALRPGKETFFYLQETLKFWIKNDFKKIPLWKLALVDVQKLKKRAKKILKNINLPFEIIESYSQFGGGTTPLYNIPSIAIRLKCKKPEDIYNFLINYEIPIVPFLKDDSINFDLRSVFEEEDEYLASALKKLKKYENL